VSLPYQQKPVKEIELPLTKRLDKITKAYDKANLIYVKTSMDDAEMRFADLVSRRPETHHSYVTSIYRLQTQPRYLEDGKSGEALIYHIKEEVMDHIDQYIELDRERGYWWNINTRGIKNAAGQSAKTQVLNYFPVFEIPFTSEAVDSIISISSVDVSQFYVGTASNQGPYITTGDIYAIKNKEDFKKGTIRELIDMGRYNYSTTDPRLAEWRAEGQNIQKQSQTISSLTNVRGSNRPTATTTTTNPS
jgi:hypothetical protein